MPEGMVLVGGLPAGLETHEDHDVGEEVRDGMGRVRDQGLALSEDPAGQLEGDQHGVRRDPYQRDGCARPGCLYARVVHVPSEGFRLD